MYYNADFVQHLHTEGSERKLKLLACYKVQFEIDNLFHNRILWTEESKFTNNGIINE